MRHTLLKLSRGHSTKAERVFGEMLKSNHIPFKVKVRVANHEVDFLIGRVIVEINGHEQDPLRNNKFVELGYIPIHFDNSEVLNNRELVNNKIKELYGTYKA